MKKLIEQVEQFIYELFDMDAYGEEIEITEEFWKEYQETMTKYYTLQAKLRELL